MGKYIDYKTFNPVYAPGLSTYAVKGEKGEKGENGTSLYYNKNSIKRNHTERDFVNEKIKNNELLTSSTNESENVVGYKPFDLVVDSDGDVYYIVEGEDGLTLGYDVIGNISSSIKKNYTITVENGTSFVLGTTIGDANVNFRYNVVYSYLDSGITNYGTLYGCKVSDIPYSTNAPDTITIEQVEIIDLLSGRMATIIEKE